MFLLYKIFFILLYKSKVYILILYILFYILRTEESEVKARWGGSFEWLYQADPPAVELDVRGVTILIADPPNICGPPSFMETQR